MFFFKKKPEADQPANRRGPYRALPSEVGDLSVSFSGPAMNTVQGQLVDLSITGIGVRIPGRRNTDLIGGDVYQVVIGSEFHNDIVTPVQLRATIEEEGGWRYGFEFIDTGALYEQLDDFFVRYFNRRSNQRMRLMAQERIAMSLDWSGGSRKVQVSDLSSSGAGFAISAQELPAIEEGDRIGVRFRLPGVEKHLEGHATLARLTLLADRFVLGVAFDLDEPDGLGRFRADLDRFVVDRAKLREAWNSLAG